MTPTETAALVSAGIAVLTMLAKYLGQLYIARRKANASQNGK